MGEWIVKTVRQKKSGLIKGGLTLFLLLVLICVSLYIMAEQTFGWFAEIKEVDSAGMGVIADGLNVDDAYYYRTKDMTEFQEVTTWDHLFSGMTPGDRVEFWVTYTSHEPDVYAGELLFAPRAGDEVPLVLTQNGTDAYYYFGSQLQVVWFGETEQGIQSDNRDTFLVSPSDNGVSHDSTQTVATLSLATFDLAPEQTYTAYFTVEFVNLPVVQNVYQNFGKNGEERCARRIVANFSLKK